MNRTWFGRKQLVASFSRYPRICVEGLRKTTQNITHVSRCGGLCSNRTRHDLKLGASPLEPFVRSGVELTVSVFSNKEVQGCKYCLWLASAVAYVQYCANRYVEYLLQMRSQYMKQVYIAFPCVNRTLSDLFVLYTSSAFWTLLLFYSPISNKLVSQNQIFQIYGALLWLLPFHAYRG